MSKGLTGLGFSACLGPLAGGLIAEGLGWRATLFRDDNYRDDELTLTADQPNLQLVTQHDCPHDGLNDCVTSIRVRPQ